MTSTAQRGFSLLELVVALAISSLLSVTTLEILRQQKSGYLFQQSYAELQENARLAEFLLDYAISHAAYQSKPNTSAHHTPATGVMDTGNKPKRYDSHELTLRLQANDEVKGCLGERIAQDSELTFFINARRALSCRRSTASHTLTQPLVEHVERFKIQYGISAPGEPAPTRYITPPADLTGLVVHSIRFQLLLRSRRPVLPVPRRQSYQFSDDRRFKTRDRHIRWLVDRIVAIRRDQPATLSHD